MKTLATFTGLQGAWEIGFTLDKGAQGLLLKIDADGEAMLRVFADEAGLTAVIHTTWQSDTPRFGKDPALDFTLTAPGGGERLRLCWRGFSFRLYVDGTLRDEEWPLGEPAGGEWTVSACEAARDFTHAPITSIEPDPEQVYDAPFQNFVLPGHNTGVGDCMPFARDGRYCLYYLFDRRGHASKKRLGAHQWAQISSADLKTWTIHPMAVGITEQWEGSICTGSLIQKEGKTYAFYAVRMSDGSPAQMTWAVSEDGVRFEKSGRSFALTAPYEPVSARDPMVFPCADGLYHMLVTTSLTDASGRAVPYGGCLAHLTSPDLFAWTQHEPFIVPGYADQPECSDYFAWNGWYYLVFSNFATARYRMSRHPLGPWLRPEFDELDATEVQVPKTAAFGERRFSTGFLARRPRAYAGNAITHELFQRADGTLGIKHLEEILPPARQLAVPREARLAAGDGRTQFSLPASQRGLRLKATLKPETCGALTGLCLQLGEHSYRLELDLAAGTASLIRPGENFSRGAGREILRAGPALAQGTAIDLIVRGDILDMTLGDGRAMTLRLDHSADAGASATLFAIAGTISAADMEMWAF